MVAPARDSDLRIEALSRDVDRLRDDHNTVDSQTQQMLLRLAEVQLNLARQDQVLNRLDAAIHGNGKPGLGTRVDRIEQWVKTISRLTWLLLPAISEQLLRAEVGYVGATGLLALTLTLLYRRGNQSAPIESAIAR